MTTEFVEEYLAKKLNENENYVVCTFYDLRIKHNLSEQEVNEFLILSRNKLENNGFKVFFTGAKYIYQDTNRVVEDNELMVAIKE